MYRIKNGFTIIELLAVIVVIGILSTITTIAYNGIQERAYASKMTTIVSTYAKAVALYAADHGNLPGSTCLGTLSDYPAEGVFEAGDCNVQYDENGNRLWAQNWLNEPAASDINEYINSSLDLKMPITTHAWSDGGYHIRGPWLAHNSKYIVYALPGDAPCDDKNYVEYADMSYCFMDIPSTESQIDIIDD